jgi:hypothetical protein
MTGATGCLPARVIREGTGGQAASGTRNNAPYEPMQTAPQTTPTEAQRQQWQLGPLPLWMVILACMTYLGGSSITLWLPQGDSLGGDTFTLAYLVALTFYLSIALGALFFVMLHHLSRAAWSVTLRRLAEGLSANLIWLAPLAVLLLPADFRLYGWSVPGTAHLNAKLAAKAGYLNPAAFMGHMTVYFAVWIFLAWFFRTWSICQDTTGDVRLSAQMERMAAPGMIAWGVTVTLAAVDLLMSLQPHWYSTMIGVYFFGGCVLAGLVVLVIAARWLQACGRLGDAVTVEHYHDPGKLIFAFVVFWGYIAFSQYMLIWYANMPEETSFFMARQIGPWGGVSLALLFCQLLIPMAGLLSRHAKRHLGVLTFWAVWLLAAHLLDLYWLIMPNVYIQRIPEAFGTPGAPLPEALGKLLASNQSVYQVSQQHETFMQVVRAPLGLAAVGIVLAFVVGLGAVFFVTTTWFLRRAPLVPIGDPRLGESLSFENQ